MKKIFTISLIGIIISIQLKGQNLVPNPGFETYTSCPTNISQLSLASPWTSPTSSTPDYFHTCNSGQAGVPNNQMGAQLPNNGDGYAGFIAVNYGSGDYKEYLQAPLLSPLIAGENYYISFYLNLTDYSFKWTDDVCVHLSNGPYFYNTNSNIPLVPQFCNQSGNYITDKTNWTLICGTYTAKGGETHITIGNFSSTSNVVGTQSSQCYYYIDDISVVQAVSLDNNPAFCSGDTILLDVTTPNSTYLWQDNSTSPTYTITLPGTYWVEITNSCGTIVDTINVSYTVPPLDLGDDTFLCKGDTLLLNATSPNTTYLWQDNSTNSTFTITNPGTYWVEINNGCGINSDTLIAEPEECDCSLYMPNCFSPNDDEINDEFSPEFNCNLQEYRLIIFDRWGEQIFETANSQASWDGTYKSRKSPIGIYIYLITYNFKDGISKTNYGNVTLIR